MMASIQQQDALNAKIVPAYSTRRRPAMNQCSPSTGATTTRPRLKPEWTLARTLNLPLFPIPVGQVVAYGSFEIRHP